MVVFVLGRSTSYGKFALVYVEMRESLLNSRSGITMSDHGLLVVQAHRYNR